MQGKHRSLSWALYEAQIWGRLGFSVEYGPVTATSQSKIRCQWRNPGGNCPDCGSARKHFEVLHADSVSLAHAAVDEFFKVVLALEALV